MMARVKEMLATLKAQLAADTKKTVALGALSVVFVVAVGRLLIKPSPPAPVAAAPAVSNATASSGGSTVRPSPPEKPRPPVGPVEEGRPIPEQIKSARTAAPRDLRFEISNSAGTGVEEEFEISNLKSSMASPAVFQGIAWNPREAVSVAAMPRVLARDLFTTPMWSKFAPAWTATQPADQESGKKGKPEDGFWAAMLKAAREKAEAQRKAREKIEEELKALALQATLTGPSPTAYVSGELVRPGSRIKGFEVMSIADRRVVLRRDGTEFVLGMP